jgi:hypothetical protein
MTDEPTPEVRALAAKLFAAGRAERPGPALGRRLLLLEPPAADDGAPSPTEQIPWGARAPSRLALWLAAAALIASGIGLFFVLERDPGAVNISPERDPGRSHANSAPAAAAVPAAPTGSEAQRNNAAELQPGADEVQSAAPRSVPAAHPRAREQRRAVDSAAPQSATPNDGVAPNAAETADSPAQRSPMTLLAELDLLKRARSALRSGEGGQALELLEQRERAHTSNGLDAEATLLRIETLAALGKPGAASELATRFVRENPNSTLGDRAKSFIRNSAPGP